MSYSPRTDLAIEAKELHLKNTDGINEGIEVSEETTDFGITITRVKVTTKTGENTLKKPKGTYITIELPDAELSEQLAYEEACRVCAQQLSSLLKGKNLENILVIGLGNRNITADALGPKTCDSVLVTRHLLKYMPEEIDSRLNSVCAIAPGVLGITGIETLEIVKGICEKALPTLIIAVDALCSRSIKRINNTLQLTDTGIVPGAGIGNRRMAIDKATLGIPVIAIGVPTVVDAATIAGDAIDLIIDDLKANAKENLPLYKMLSVLAEEDKYSMIKQVLSPNECDFIVTPKEIDTAITKISDVIANGINLSLHEGITSEDIDRYK